MSDKKANDNHADQLNYNNDKYYTSRGMDSRPSDWSSGNYGGSGNTPTQSDLNNHGNQLNPNNDEYNHSREAGSKK